MADRKIFGNSGPVDPNLKRTTFDKSFVNNLTAKMGLAIPVLVEEAPPNSSYSIDTDFAFDFHSMWYPVQNNITAHLSLYSVPFRILWKHHRRFESQIGADGRINGTQNYTMPYIKRAPGWYNQGSLADYMGLPSNFFTEKDRDVEMPLSRICAFYHVPDNMQYLTYEIESIPSSIASLGYYLAFPITHFPQYKLKSTCTIEIPVYAADVDQMSTFIDQAVSQGTTFKVFFAKSTSYNNSHSTFNDDETLMDGLTVNSWDIDYVTSFIQNGNTVYQYKLTLTLDSSGVAYYNANNFFEQDKKCFIAWTSSIETPRGATMLQILNYHDYLGRPSAPAPLSLDVLDPDSKPIVYSGLHSNIVCLGHGDNCTLSCVLPTNGSRDYFASVEGADPAIPINALPFRAYEFIKNYFFRNSRVTPFYKDGQPCYDEYITNDGDGADETTPLSMFRVPWEYDMFTTAVPEPFFGNAPLVGVTTNRDSNGDINSAVFHMVDENNNPYSFTVDTTSDGRITGISLQGTENGNAANTPAMDALNYAIQYGISIADFRNANALTRFQEKFMRAGTKPENISKEFFGVRPPTGEEYPRYLGGVSRRVMVNKITNTAQSEGNPLGDFAGNAAVSGHGKRIKCFCAERCYIIGILYFTTTPLYSQQLPKHFLKSKLLDYYNPLFANISPQPIYCKEIAPLQLTPDELDDVFGYGRPYADYVSRRDEVHGDFRGDMSDFLFQRLFYERPKLNSSFLTINSADLTNIFSNTDDNDKIFGQVAFGIRAKLPMPKFSVPQIV